MNFKRYDFYFVILLLIIFAVFVFMNSPVQYDTDTVVFQTSSGSVAVNVEVAQTRDELHTGLMYREHLDENSGMLFIFENPILLSFWMKNTLINLDMIFLSEDLEILKIERDVPPCETVACPKYGEVFGKYVLEVNGGFCDANGIKEGDKIHLLLNMNSSQN